MNKVLRRYVSSKRCLCFYWNRIVRGVLIDRPPIFIVGCGHSGTSLALAILGTHSKIHAIPFESGFATGEVADIASMNSQRRRFEMDAVRAGKRRWIEKTPRHVHHMGRLLQWMPEAKILLIVRDGRDVACSIRERTGSLEGGMIRWIRDNEAGREFWNHSSVHVFKYEDLVHDFEETLRSVLEFLGEEYEPQLRDFHRGPKRFYSETLAKPSDAREPNHNQYRNWQINQPLFDGSGRWRDLALDEQSLLHARGGELLEEFGYLSPSSAEDPS